MTCCLCSRSVRAPAPNRKWPLSCSGRHPRGRRSTSGGRHRRQTSTWTAGWRRWMGHVAAHTPSARRAGRVYIAACPAATKITHEGRWKKFKCVSGCSGSVFFNVVGNINNHYQQETLHIIIVTLLESHKHAMYY